MNEKRAQPLDAEGLQRLLKAAVGGSGEPYTHTFEFLPPPLDVDRLARVLAGYRLNRTEYFAPNLAPSGDRLMDEHEWAAEIAAAYASEVSGQEGR